jgi:hypothetical protein
MKNALIKKALPHVIAIIIFLVVTMFFGRPALEGNMLDQGDIDGWRGIAQNAFDYKSQHGHYPLWNPNVFSGMPNYMIVMEGKSILPDITSILSLGLPQPINQFFIACLCFYILCLSVGARPIVGIFGALAFGFATYNPIIIEAGHVTKMFAIAYMPLLLAGLINVYEKRYWLGLALTTLGTYLQIVSNHPQISYYAVITAGIITLAYLIHWIIKKEYKHIAIAAGIAIAGVVVGVMGNAMSYLITSEYSKSTIRGGKSVEIKGDQVSAIQNTGGLDTNYAFSYSLGKGEALTTLMPNAYGGNAKRRLPEESEVTEKLTSRGVPLQDAAQVSASLPKYWGQSDSTSGGPLYAGAIVCILALIGFVLYKHPLRWALLAVSFLAILMAWGRHLPGFNYFLFEHLPLYNKFRAPTITMVIVQLTLPLAAVLGAQLLFFRDNSREELKKDFRKILYALGGLTVFLLILYVGMDYSTDIDANILSGYSQNGNDSMARVIVSALKSERQSMFGGQILRTVGFMALVLALLWAYMKKMAGAALVVGILAAITLIDLLVIDKDYLSEENYRTKDSSDAPAFVPSPVDKQILADTSKHYRVFSAGDDRFSQSDYRVSIFHKAIGGYHAAKLRIYNDVLLRYLYGADPTQVLNMLNTKYIIQTDRQTGQQTITVNPNAYGPAWFVKGIKVVKDDVEELQSLGITNLKDTAVVQQSLAAKAGRPQWDSAAAIRLTKFDNDAIEYSTTATTPQFAVFSEIYYPYGWNAYIDGNKAEYIRTNYTLRGLAVPAGNHTVRFVFEPSSYKTGTTLTYIASYLILLLVVGGLFMHFRQQRKQQQQEAPQPAGAKK